MRPGSHLARALDALGATLDDPLVQEHVRRAEFDRDGKLWLDLEGGPAWWRFDDPGVVRVEPREDERLPLARRLGDVRDDAILAWRPGRRVVAAIGEGDSTVIHKGHRRSRFARALARQRAAARIGEQCSFAVPALVDVDEAAATLVLARVDGLEPGFARSDADDFRTIGRGIAEMQAADPGCELDRHTAQDELDVVDATHRRLVRAIGRGLDGFELLRERVAALAPRANETFVPCHRDLHDRQFLLGANGPSLLDFDSLCEADSALDPANLLAHVALRRLQGLAGVDAQGARACSEALVDGLGPVVDRTFFEHLRFYQSTSLLRLACVYAIRPRWSHLGPCLVGLAQRCADDEHAGSIR
ncbi:MAG: hypothetical protein R3F34_03385 [Planctomycetota bacterium]